MTRGRHENHALILDADDTTDAATVITDIITRPSRAEPALAVRDRLHHEAGIDPPETTLAAQTADRPAPDAPRPVERTHEQKIAAAQARLDRVQYRDTGRDQDRGLGL